MVLVLVLVWDLTGKHLIDKTPIFFLRLVLIVGEIQIVVIIMISIIMKIVEPGVTVVEGPSIDLFSNLWLKRKEIIQPMIIIMFFSHFLPKKVGKKQPPSHPRYKSSWPSRISESVTRRHFREKFADVG